MADADEFGLGALFRIETYVVIASCMSQGTSLIRV